MLSTFEGLLSKQKFWELTATKIGQVAKPYEGSHAPDKRERPIGRLQVEGYGRN